MPANPFDGALWVRKFDESPLLADPDWVISFRWMVSELLDAGRAATRHASLPNYSQAVIEAKWKPWLDGLVRHLCRVVEDGRNPPPFRVFSSDANISEAYQLACAALAEGAGTAGPTEAIMAALEDVAGRLARWQAPTDSTNSRPPASPSLPDPGSDPADPAPPPKGNHEPIVPPVVLGKPGDEPIVNGKRTGRLTRPQFDVVKTLLAAGDKGLSKDSLATESGHGDAHRILRRLADSDPAWKAVIQMAEIPGGGYRIRSAGLPKSPDISRRAPTKRNKGRS